MQKIVDKVKFLCYYVIDKNKTKRGIQKMTLDEIRKQTQAYKNFPKFERVVFHNYLVQDFSKFCEK